MPQSDDRDLVKRIEESEDGRAGILQRLISAAREVFSDDRINEAFRDATTDSQGRRHDPITGRSEDDA